MKIIFVGGGTGGHIFPALATIEVLKSHKCVFVTNTLAKRISRSKYFDFTIEYIPITKSSITAFLWSFIISIGKSLLIFKKYRPDIIVGFGGYPTLPILVIAVFLRIPIILHESNSILGKVNKLFLPFAKKLAFFFPTIEESMDGKYKDKLELTGVPVSNDIKQVKYCRIKGKVNLLIVGGSQGASVFSKILPDAIKKIIDEGIDCSIHHQCPKQDAAGLSSKYSNLGITAEVSNFFQDIPRRFAKADIIICRAGASTIAEILASGKTAIYVPYSHSTMNHQMSNAQFIAKNNAGILITEQDFTSENLIRHLKELINNPEKLQNISSTAYKIAISNAKENFANLIEETIENGGSGGT